MHVALCRREKHEACALTVGDPVDSIGSIIEQYLYYHDLNHLSTFVHIKL